MELTDKLLGIRFIKQIPKSFDIIKMWEISEEIQKLQKKILKLKRLKVVLNGVNSKLDTTEKKDH